MDQGSAKILRSTTVFNIVFTAPNQHISMITERSSDTEDWIMADNSALASQKKYIVKYILK